MEKNIQELNLNHLENVSGGGNLLPVAPNPWPCFPFEFDPDKK